MTNNGGCVFSHWEGYEIDGSTNPSETIVMDSDKEVTAYFDCLPLADFRYEPSRPEVNQDITFISTSTHLCGKIVAYEWDFNDGTTDVTEDPKIVHAYSEEGSYSVKLTIITADEKTDTTEKRVVVKNTEEPSEDEKGTVEGTIIEKTSQGEKPIFKATILIQSEEGGIWTESLEIPNQSTFPVQQLK